MSVLAYSPKASRILKPQVVSSPKGRKNMEGISDLIAQINTSSHKEPPFKQMSTQEIYRKIAGKGPLKWKAVRDIFSEVMQEAMKQAQHTGSFELAAMMLIKVETIPSTNARTKVNASKKIVKTIPMKWMSNLMTKQ